VLDGDGAGPGRASLTVWDNPAVLSIAAAVVAGLMMVSAFPLRGWALMVVPAVALFLWAIRRTRRTWVAALAGTGFGLTFFGLLFPWIAELGLVALVPLLAVQTLYFSLYAALVSRLRGSDLRWWVAATGGWALTEFARERFPFEGFAWGMAGLPAGEVEATRNAAQWIGTSGWTVLVVALAGGIVLAVERRQATWFTATVSPVVALAVLGSLVGSAPDGPELRVAIVQGSTPCPGEHCPGEREESYRSSLALTRTLPAGAFDLVVWPESSLGFATDPVNNPAFAAELSAEARRLRATLMAGTDRPVDETGFINANIVFDPNGELVGEYRKQHPVPFGEYVPFRSLFGRIPALAAVPRDMIRGEGPVVFDTGFGPFGSVISFESAFARYPRRTVRSGADLLVVATNQNSYPFSPASDQLIGITRMHAAALGVDLVHGAITGRSTIITQGGVVGELTSLGEPAVITGTARLRTQGPTLYALMGDWVQWLAIGFLVPLWRRLGRLSVP
jgi:apolipoprotein N-acyltransferase